MKNKIIILFFVIIFLIQTVNASVYNYPSNVSLIINELPVMHDITCKFKQEKHLKNISKPIISEGNFKFVKNTGVFFETLYPIKSSVSYTNKDYKQINDIIIAISNKRYYKLEKEFNFFFYKQAKNWTLGLKPKQNSQSINYITYITIYGSNNIDKIEILLNNGNRTILWFITK